MWFKKATKSNQFVLVLDNQFTADLSTQVLAYASHFPDRWVNAELGTSTKQLAQLIQKEYAPELDKEILSIANKAGAEYKKRHEDFHYTLDSGYEILKHDGPLNNGNQNAYWTSAATMIMFLNDSCCNEGALLLPEQDLVVKARVGRVVLFPGNFMFPFRRAPSEKKSIYSLFTNLR